MSKAPMEPIAYPPEFVAAVKAAYPGFDALHDALDRGLLFVGRYLDDSCGLRMSPEQIVKAFVNGREKWVLAAATRATLRDALYLTWCDIAYPEEP